MYLEWGCYRHEIPRDQRGSSQKSGACGDIEWLIKCVCVYVCVSVCVFIQLCMPDAAVQENRSWPETYPIKECVKSKLYCCSLVCIFSVKC